MGSSRFRAGALVACALVGVFFVVGSTAAADDATPPTLSIAITPQNPTPGSDVTFTATVTPGTNTDIASLQVNCNLSWAGKGSSAPLAPDATGLVFSLTFTVASNAVPGERVGTCTVADQQLSSSTDYSLTIASPETDAPPTIKSHTPDDGATGVAVDANIGITFSEPVDVTGSWFSISCDQSGSVDADVTGSADAYLLNPTAEFKNGEQCTVSLVSALVTDSGKNELSGDTSWSFTIVEAPVNQPPTVATTGPYAVNEGGTVSVSANGLDPENGALTYDWDLDGNGSFETPGQTVSFSADDGHVPATAQNIAVRVTDAGGLTATAASTVTIGNVAPTATLGAPATVFAGFPFTLSLTSPHDPSTADTKAGFTYAFDCGDHVYGVSASCATSDVGPLSVRAKIQDKDGGVTTYTATVQVIVTFGSLCDLVRSYSTDPKVADDLCAKLAQAEAGSPGSLGAFRNQADAKVGKGLTADQAAELKLLSTSL